MNDARLDPGLRGRERNVASRERGGANRTPVILGGGRRPSGHSPAVFVAGAASSIFRATACAVGRRFGKVTTSASSRCVH